MDSVELLIGEGHGINIPKVFYNAADLTEWGLDPEEFVVLNDPYHEWYWEAWGEVLSRAESTDKVTGRKYTLWQDGDLFAIATDFGEVDPEGYREFFGEDYIP